MSNNLEEQTAKIFQQLNNPIVELNEPHVRGIVLPNDVTLEGLKILKTDTIDLFAQNFLHLTILMLEKISSNGVFVQFEGNTVTICGYKGETPKEPTLNDLFDQHNRTDNRIQIHCKNPPSLHVDLFNPYSEQNKIDIADEINFEIDQIPPKAKYALVKGILLVISDELNQIFDA